MQEHHPLQQNIYVRHSTTHIFCRQLFFAVSDVDSWNGFYTAIARLDSICLVHRSYTHKSNSIIYLILSPHNYQKSPSFMTS